MLFSWLFLLLFLLLCLLLCFSKVACYGHSQRTYRLIFFLLLWYISGNISSVLCEGNLWIYFWWCSCRCTMLVWYVCWSWPFLWCTLNLYLLLMVLVILISKKIKDLFSFSYSMVYWIAGSCLFKISWKVFAWCFDVKWAWLSSTYRLNVFGCICLLRLWPLLCVPDVVNNFQIILP